MLCNKDFPFRRPRRPPKEESCPAIARLSPAQPTLEGPRLRFGQFLELDILPQLDEAKVIHGFRPQIL